MVEQIYPSAAAAVQPVRARERDPAPSLTIAAIKPLLIPSIHALATQEMFRSTFGASLERIKRKRPRPTPSPPAEHIIFAATPHVDTPRREPAAVFVWPPPKEPPLLPAPPHFEDVFKPFEPMFHTVFYRRYPEGYRDDAKQDALLHLWKQWKKDMTILEQSAAYVIQMAIWGASPHRKIQKDKVKQQAEVPMPRFERYIDIRIADQSRDPGWMRRLDLSIDLQSAIERVRRELAAEPNADANLGILEDIVRHRSITAGQQQSSLSTRGYRAAREAVHGRLKGALVDYADYL